MAEIKLGLTIRGMKALEKIKQMRGITSDYRMSRMLDISQTSYKYLRDNAKGVSFDMLVKIRKAFGLSWSELGKLIESEIAENHQEVGKKKPSRKPKDALG